MERARNNLNFEVDILKETDRQIDRQADRHTGKQSGRQAGRLVGRPSDREIIQPLHIIVEN
jgi:hypothetical protein